MEGRRQLIGWWDMRPRLFRLGVALAISLTGYLRFRPRLPPPTSPSAPSAAVGDDLSDLTDVETLAKIINDTSCTTTAATATTVMELSLSANCSGDEVGFLLPEFNQLVLKEFEASGQDPEDSPTTPTSSESEIEDKLAMEQEIAYLRNLVESLRERERTLEIQLLGYHELREQEGAVKELENRLKINETEAKLFSLKLESLQAENQTLRAQASDYPRMVTQLKSVRAKIELLKRKLRSDGESAKEKISTLHQRVAMLENKVHENEGDSAEVEEKLKRLNELEDQAMDLRKLNSRLAQENSELKLKLRSTEMPSTSVLKCPDLAELLEEANCLREESDKLKKDIEQLHNNRCADVEELVYLRWINACLRYELRNYQPPPGKTVARDLSKSLSPNSEHKAKQLIVEYANFDIDERNLSLIDFDSDYCSSQASNEEPEDTLIDACSMTKSISSRKSKFISKLKKLVLGKDHSSKKVSSVDKTTSIHGNSERRESVSPCSFEDAIGIGSNNSFSSCISVEFGSANQSIGTGSHGSERWQNKDAQPQSYSRSLDIHRPRRLNLEEIGEHCKSEVGTSCSYQSLLSGDDSLIDLSPKSSLDHGDTDVVEKAELRKFAEALKSSRRSPKLKKRAVSFSFN